MFSLISKTGEQLVEHFSQKNEDLVVVEIKEAFTKIANDVIASVTFGCDCNSLEDPRNDFYIMSKNIMEEGMFRTVRFFGYLAAPKLYDVSIHLKITTIVS